MDLYIRNKNFEIVKIIRNATSVVWQKSYNDVGQCAFTIPISQELFDVLVNGYYVTRFDDDMICEIKQININTNIDTGENYYQIVALDFLNVFNQRIVWSTEIFNGNVESAIRTLIDHNCINTTNYGGTNRKIDDLVLGTTYGFTDTIEKQVTYDNLLDTILSLCKTYDYGIKLVRENNKFVVKLYNGVDRSYNQIINPYVVFHEKNHNLKTSKYLLDSSSHKNMALVGGKGEGSERTLVRVNDNLKGLNRYETFVDASSLEETSNYDKQLEQQGKEVLESLKIIETFAGDVTNTRLYRYKEDFNLGDIVTTGNNLGISKNSRIRMIKESYDINGNDLLISFDN